MLSDDLNKTLIVWLFGFTVFRVWYSLHVYFNCEDDCAVSYVTSDYRHGKMAHVFE